MSLIVLVVWMLALSVVVLYLFFFGLAGVSPFESMSVTVVVAVLAFLYAIRTARVGREMRDRAGDPQLHAEYNRARERRGF